MAKNNLAIDKEISNRLASMASAISKLGLAIVAMQTTIGTASGINSGDQTAAATAVTAATSAITALGVVDAADPQSVFARRVARV